jgi:hypothetical protein
MLFSSSTPALTEPQVEKKLSPELRLLLTCARLSLSSGQREELIYLCEQIKDWNVLFKLADDQFILPLLLRHLRAEVPELTEEIVAQPVRKLCQNQAGKSLGMVVEQQKLGRLFDSLEIKHAFFKGISLSHNYYGDISLRKCRDIDLLVSPTQISEVLSALVEHEYSTSGEALSLEELKLLFYGKSQVSLRSPNGIFVEVHLSLDHVGSIFPTDWVLDNIMTIDLFGFPLRVLPTYILFVYICYHHSRHQWSKLHWVSDLDALIQHPSFTLQEVLDYAADSGLMSTVTSSLGLYEILSHQSPELLIVADSRVRGFRNICIESLVTGEELRYKLVTRDFRFFWQANSRYIVNVVTKNVFPNYGSDLKFSFWLVLLRFFRSLLVMPYNLSKWWLRIFKFSNIFFADE